MPTCRDLVKRAIDFRGPEWTPYIVSCNPDQLSEYSGPQSIAALKQALRNMGVVEVNGWFTAHRLSVNLGPDETELPAPYRPLQPDEWVDEWGVVWTNREFPRVIGHPFEAGWEARPSYKLPDPLAAGRYDDARRRLAAEPPDPAQTAPGEQHNASPELAPGSHELSRVSTTSARYRLGWVWFTLFERLWFLRGFNNMLMDPYLNPREWREMAERIVEFSLVEIEQQLRLGADGIYFSDDWGSQEGLLMNPADWRRWYKPLYKRLFDAVRAGGAHVWMHLCGNVTAIIPDLLDLGLNVLNPIQPQAMDVDALAAQFGGRVCFHGGVDIQETLPHGTPADVEREVRRLIDIFGRYSGGYIGATAHTIMPETPPENILALFRAFREHSGQGDT